MKRTSIFLLLSLVVFSCAEIPVSDLSNHSIIPLPRQVEATGGYFLFSQKTEIIAEGDDASLVGLAGSLEMWIPVPEGPADPDSLGLRKKKNSIVLMLCNDSTMHPEGYRIDISEEQITIGACAPCGVFHGIQTLRQLLMLPGSCVSHSEKGFAIPTGTITDHPEYPYRATMLDVSRHFFPPEVVKAYIDQLTLYKISHLHLHLSDDQGWRIEIKSWPKLTEIGGSTQVGGGEGGFYTQEEYTDLVAYAAERCITIVPEIDMPGHTNAALASYAELNCDGKARELYTGTRVGFSTLCTDKEITYEFVDDVVREITALTPGPYFHVGGDESHVTEKDDYIYFMNRVKKIVHKYGKTMIGWDEISHAALDESDLAQYWASEENAVRASEKGARLVMSPSKHAYLDMKYDSTTVLGLNWAGYTEVDKAYNWHPRTLVEGVPEEMILGIDAPLWSETIEKQDELEFLAFPRILGHAEIGWSDPDALNWESYRDRLAAHGKLLEEMNVNFYRSPLVDW
jgi:hexosaminidase